MRGGATVSQLRTDAQRLAGDRDWDAAVELVTTPCGRVVERRATIVVRADGTRVVSQGSTTYYTAFELAPTRSVYGDELTLHGRRWGAIHTRRPVLRAEDGDPYDAARRFELGRWAEAYRVIRLGCVETQLGESVYESRGQILTLGTPRVGYERVQAERRKAGGR